MAGQASAASGSTAVVLLQQGSELALVARAPDPRYIGNLLDMTRLEGEALTPASELERVFDRFRLIEENSDRAGSDRGKGVDLGLSISKGFVEAMGGRIAAASPIHGDVATVMRGARILISLPKTVPTSHLLL